MFVPVWGFLLIHVFIMLTTFQHLNKAKNKYVIELKVAVRLVDDVGRVKMTDEQRVGGNPHAE